MSSRTPLLLCVMDGFGEAAPGPANAVHLAEPRTLLSLREQWAFTTLQAASGSDTAERIDLMIDRAKACFDLLDDPDATECDLVVKGNSGSEARGWLGKLQGACDKDPVLLFQGDRQSDPLLTDAQLRALAAGEDRLTYTCVPPGSGQRKIGRAHV